MTQVNGPRASVIIPAYNASETIEACLLALWRQTVAREVYEVIVVDDGSTDNTADIARAAGAQVISQPNAGPATARNRGARAADGELLLFTDADCEPVPGWIEAFLDAFDDEGIVAAKGTYLTRQRSLTARFVQVEYEERYRITARAATVDSIDTYSAAYRRQVFMESGGFDPTFPFAAQEDVDLSFRLARKGYKMTFVPSAQVYHRHPSSPWAYARRKFRVGWWKVLVVQRYPERAMRDSHTPQTLKLQLLFLAAVVLLIPAAAVLTWLRPALMATVLGFLILTFPLMILAARHDTMVAAVAPAFILLRASALGAGFVAGLVRGGYKRSSQRGPGPLAGLAKRVLDVAGAGLGLLLCAPLLLLIAVALKIDSPGPVFSAQDRVGRYGRVFRMIWFRSAGLGSRSGHHQGSKTTRVERFLRRTNLDRLPQLWNVFKGEMSLVGPRADQVHVARTYRDWHRKRLLMRPGMTGPGHFSDVENPPLDQRVKVELDYITHYSLIRDFAILRDAVLSTIHGKES